MYIQWLLEFVWRIFIQGPLLIIDALTSSSFWFNIEFDFLNSKNKDIFNYGVFALVSFAILAIVMVLQFFYIFSLNEGSIKQRMINSFSQLGKSLFFVLIIPIVIFLTLVLFNLTTNFILDLLKIDGYKSLAESIMKLIDSTADITGDKKFDPPALAKLENINFILAIFLVWINLIFIFWVFYSFFQKIIEAFALYISFPLVAVSVSHNNYLKRKIWIKEMLTKFVYILVILLIYGFYLVTISSIININSITKNKEVLVLVLSFGLIFAMFSVIKLLGYILKQHSGIIPSVKSSRQTINFMNKVKNEDFITNNNYQSNNSNINSNVEVLRKELRNSSKNNSKNFEDLKKVRLFNENK